jgi:hypothetical protein
MVFDLSKVVALCWGVLTSMQVEVKSENILAELEPDNTGARNRVDKGPFPLRSKRPFQFLGFPHESISLMKTSKTKKPRTPDKDRPEKGKEQEFPGYEKYDPAEDITRRGRRVEGSLDDEPDNIPAKGDGRGASELTKEDLEALGPKDLSMDMGDDEQLKHRIRPVDFAGSDLDVPGSELDDADEETGNEDEENNSYSLGGDKEP